MEDRDHRTKGTVGGKDRKQETMSFRLPGPSISSVCRIREPFGIARSLLDTQLAAASILLTSGLSRPTNQSGCRHRGWLILCEAQIPCQGGAGLFHSAGDDGAIPFIRYAAKKLFLLFRGDTLFRFQFQIEAVIAASCCGQCVFT
jgi:hypothetical protein